MSQAQAADSIEAEAALLRAQILTAGADLRLRADPAAIVEMGKAAMRRKTKAIPGFLKENGSPVGLVLLGGAAGAVVTGLFSKRRAALPPQPASTGLSASAMPKPPLRAHARAVLLSTLGVGLGYFAGLLVPNSAVEEQLVGQPKAVLRERLDEFLQANMRGMKLAVFDLFGVSRLSAAALIGLAVIAQALGGPTPKAQRKPL